MGELRESSVLFSLNGLMDLERDRLRGEAEAARSREAAEASAREAHARALREAEQARLLAEEERRRREGERAREEAARLEAMRAAAIERARVDAEREAELARRTQEQVHERAIAAIQEDAQKRRLRRAVVTLAAVVAVASLATAGIYFGKVRPDQERESERIAAEIALKNHELEALRDVARQQDARVSELDKRVRDAQDDAQREKAERERDAAKSKAAEAHRLLGGFGPAAPAAPRGTRKQDCVKCADGDPMCECLK